MGGQKQKNTHLQRGDGGESMSPAA